MNWLTRRSWSAMLNEVDRNDQKIRQNKYLGVPEVTNWLVILKNKGGEKNNMDIMKVLQHGLKAFLFVLLATLLMVLVGALSLALNFKPDGALAQVLWQFAALPLLTGLIAALENWRKHLNDAPAK